MKTIFKDTYGIVGLVNGKLKKDLNQYKTLDEIKEYLKSLGFGTRGRLKFEDEVIKKEVDGYDDQHYPVFKETLTSIFKHEDFNRGSTMLTVMKFRYYSPFSELLEEDEYLYYLEDTDLKQNDIVYLISDNERIFKLNINTNKVYELKIETERDRIEIKGFKYKIEYLKSIKGDKYKF